MRVPADELPAGAKDGDVLVELRGSVDATFVRETLDSLKGVGDEPTIVLSLLENDDVRESMRASGCTPSVDLKPEGFSLRPAARRNRLQALRLRRRQHRSRRLKT